ncbi:hypothetical protein BC829DRAFT_446289 [Chytridium lagenaria]|nr:hypothetical protein BC829DRAFT_446289 [Chytridium lagenaria]
MPSHSTLSNHHLQPSLRRSSTWTFKTAIQPEDVDVIAAFMHSTPAVHAGGTANTSPAVSDKINPTLREDDHAVNGVQDDNHDSNVESTLVHGMEMDCITEVLGTCQLERTLEDVDEAPRFQGLDDISVQLTVLTSQLPASSRLGPFDDLPLAISVYLSTCPPTPSPSPPPHLLIAPATTRKISRHLFIHFYNYTDAIRAITLESEITRTASTLDAHDLTVLMSRLRTSFPHQSGEPEDMKYWRDVMGEKKFVPLTPFWYELSRILRLHRRTVITIIPMFIGKRLGNGRRAPFNVTAVSRLSADAMREIASALWEMWKMHENVRDEDGVVEMVGYARRVISGILGELMIKEGCISFGIALAALAASAIASAPSTRSEAESFFTKQLSAQQTRENLRYYTSIAHTAGSVGDKQQVDWTKDKLIEFGFTDVVLDEYQVLLNTPKKRSLTLLSPTRFEASLTEDIVDEDEASHDQQQVPTFHGYGKSGEATGSLVYANYGRKEDYDLLIEKGIDFKDKIVIVKYGGVFRGLKVRGAELAGAKGVLIYSDPKDDGYVHGKVYPEGPWRPPTGVQRGSVQYLSLYSGDPLTPFEPALPNATRLPQEEAPNLPKIPSLPISYADAEPFLRALRGAGIKSSDLGDSWQGGLDFEYWTGPSAEVHLNVEHNYGITPIWNVIATVKGAKYPDRAVIVGNHRDAWVRGAIDPSSGSAAILEYARAIGELLKTGWKPDRTLIIASWDDILNATAVAYINMDSGCGGPNFGASASPSLSQLIRDVTKDIIDPTTKKSVYERWLERDNSDDFVGDEDEDDMKKQGRSLKKKPSVGALGSGSDFTGFLQHIGISALDVGFGSNGDGTYHSNYDSFHWMSKFGDPTFEYHRAAAEVLGRLSIRLLSDKVLAFDPTAYAKTLLAETESLKIAIEDAGFSLIGDDNDEEDDEDHHRRRLQKRDRDHRHSRGRVNLKPLRDVVESYLDAAKELWRFKERVEKNDEPRKGLVFQNGDEDDVVDDIPEDHIRLLNDKLAFAERGFLDSEGIPGRPWYRHIIYAPGLWFGYASQTFPAIREAIPSGAIEIQARIKRAADVLKAAVERIKLPPVLTMFVDKLPSLFF